MADEHKGHSRVNFFTGFQTTAEDWNHVIKYDVEKHKLHNRLFHGPGVVPDVLGSLKVAARGRGDLSVEVSPGYAIDASGNDIYLPEPEIKTINPGDFKLPQTVYIVVKYVEEMADFVTYRANLEYKGHRRIYEQVKVEAIITPPDITREVEIARIQMTKGVKRITDAKDPDNPRNNEIDLRFVPRAGTVGSNLSPEVLKSLDDVIENSKLVYQHMAHKLRISTASDVNHALITMSMLKTMNMLDASNLYELWDQVFELQEHLVKDVEENYPKFSSKKEFVSFKKHIELLEGMYNEGKGKGAFTPEFMTNIIGYQKKGTENLTTVFAFEAPVKGKVEEQVADAEAMFEKLKVKSDDLGEVIEMDGVKLKQVDFIDVLKKKSESAHKFRIVDARDKYRTRQKLKYPDGVIVEDTGIAFEGGYAEWEVMNVAPNKDLIMITRMDYVHGEWEAEITVNGKKVGTSVCKGEDRKFRWRNWPFKISAEYVTDTFLTIKKTPLTADRDINMFKIWFYQPA